jgi:cytochrome c-type biogenesis protein
MLENFQLYISHPSPLMFIFAFLAGILTSLTPCVYPIIPILISYVVTQSKGSRAKGFAISLLYVLGVSVTYSALGAASALTGSFFGEIQNSVIPNLIVGNICLFFGLSMLDVFSFNVPFLSGISRKPRMGLAGAFLFGIISGLVASPCTAPVLAVILTFVASKQNIILGISLLFSFSLGMGLLLVIIGTFSSVLMTLPKPGGWMIKVKKIMGFVFILIAEYYLVKAGKCF